MFSFSDGATSVITSDLATTKKRLRWCYGYCVAILFILAIVSWDREDKYPNQGIGIMMTVLVLDSCIYLLWRGGLDWSPSYACLVMGLSRAALAIFVGACVSAHACGVCSRVCSLCFARACLHGCDRVEVHSCARAFSPSPSLSHVQASTGSSATPSRTSSSAWRSCWRSSTAACRACPRRTLARWRTLASTSRRASTRTTCRARRTSSLATSA
jgi:hypothetical protein